MSNSISPSEKVRVHAFISGKVQGVGYRYSTVEQGQKLGINGWVRNLSDGKVEAVFEGKPEIVEQMIRWCHDGPPTAVVSGVDFEYEDVEGLQGFEFLR
ncbi:MAG: acylphosphatase [Cyanobacteria bacterium P01_A01_bin.84]